MASKAKKEAKRLEKLRQEAELFKSLKREQLQREMTAQATHRKAIDDKWQKLMLKMKEPVFKKDIEVMWHEFERTYDKKDYVIACTMKLMDVADDQFQRTVASFCTTLDTMINKFLFDLEDMAKDNERKTAALLKMGEDEADQIRKDHDAAETHLQLLLYHGHTTADTLAWTTRGENLVKLDEDRTKYLDERENLRSYLENAYSNMWDDYKAVLKAYVLNTAENQKEVRKLRRKENLMADIIATQAKRIANSDGLLRRLRLELQAYESGTKQAVFRDRRDRHREACFKLKQRMVNGVAIDERQLGVLVRSSDSAVEWLEEALKKGEKILRMASLCRRFETQREKVLPFGTLEPHLPTEIKTNLRKQQSEDSLVINAIQSTCGLTRLWQRIAKAELTRRALLREKALLEDENEMIVNNMQELKTRASGPSNKCICAKSLSTNLE